MKRPADAYLRRVLRQPVNLSPAPGEPARSMGAVDAVRLAESALATGDGNRAIHIGDQLRQAPGLVSEGLRILLHVSLGTGRPRDIWNCTRQLEAAGAHDARLAHSLALGLDACLRQREALAVLDEALKGAPGDPRLRELRGRILAEQNDTAGAEAELRRALKLEPKWAAPYRQLALLGRLGPDDVAALEKGNFLPGCEVDVAFVLATACRQRKDHAREFEYLEQAHGRLRQADDWDPDEETTMARDIIALFDGPALERLRALAPPDPGRRPLFIVGMPRSGSTLAEQILASTGEAQAAGESQLFPWLLLDLGVRRHNGIEFPQLLPHLTADDLKSLQRDYLDAVRDIYTPAPVFIDKQFTNYKFVGLLAALFPSARFVHTVRDPLDTILSTWQHLFPALGYSHDLGHLGLACRDRTALMAHWHRLLPGRIHDFVYERVVAEPEREIRGLLEFCGLAWNDKALRFHETDRPVRTASLLQVRTPLYTSSVGRAAAYGALLDPARQALATPFPAGA